MANNHWRYVELHEIYLAIRPEDIAYIKFIFESYEGVGILRTVDRKNAVIVLLIVDDFRTVARSILDSLQNEISFAEISRPADLGDDWLLRELATESSSRS